MDNFPPARRPHKSPAHTVKDHGNRPQRRVPCPAPKCPSEPHIIQPFSVTSTPRDEVFSKRRDRKPPGPSKGRELCPRPMGLGRGSAHLRTLDGATAARRRSGS